MPILVEIKTHPVLFYHDLNIFVVLCQVLTQGYLLFDDDLHHEGENLSGAIVDYIQVALKRGVNAVTKELIELNLAGADLVIKGLDAVLEV